MKTREGNERGEESGKGKGGEEEFYTQQVCLTRAGVI